MPIEVMPSLYFLAAQSACFAVKRLEKISSLAGVEFRVASQFGQDGIIDWLLHWLAIENKTFIEIGASYFNQANTRVLLENRNWRGLLIDADSRLAEIRDSYLMWRHDVSMVQSFVDIDNINKLIESANFKGDIGLLSIDVDGNDYWLWRAVHTVKPIVVVCEYNAVFGDRVPAAVPYDPAFERSRAHPSMIYWGASIKAFVNLATERGYQLVGTDSVGLNAFFVRNDYLARVEKRIEDASPRPLLNRTPRSGYAGGLRRFELIADMPVVDLRDGATPRLKELQPVYSDEWLSSLA